jgi:rare lipoprotein A (peptidoglycan hydrolase)
VKTRLIDLSYSAAKDLGLINSGTASVTLKVISLGEPNNIHSETSIPVIFSAFVPELLKKKYQYMTVVKQSDGNANIVYSDVKQQ